jgi:hypothetical protein
MNLTTDLLKVYKPKESSKMDHFYTLGALMLAHANLVIVSHENDDCLRYIEKFNSQIASDKKEIDLKTTLISTMKTKQELENEEKEILASQETFTRQSQYLEDEIREIKRRIDNFEGEYFAEL